MYDLSKFTPSLHELAIFVAPSLVAASICTTIEVTGFGLDVGAMKCFRIALASGLMTTATFTIFSILRRQQRLRL